MTRRGASGSRAAARSTSSSSGATGTSRWRRPRRACGAVHGPDGESAGRKLLVPRTGCRSATAGARRARAGDPPPREEPACGARRHACLRRVVRAAAAVARVRGGRHGRSLCAAARLLGWRTIVADAREKFATANASPADRLIVAWPGRDRRGRPRRAHRDRRPHPRRQVRRARPGGGPRDRRVLHRGARVAPKPGAQARASARGRVAEEELVRISGRGLDVGADTQEETALLAEILAVRADRDGGRLRDSAQRIHAEIA